MVSPEQWARIKEIVGIALECEADERAGLLERECAGDASLRAEVDSLIAAYDKTDGLSLPGWAGVFSGVSEAPRTIGPYRLVRELGVGGMGQVWLADQSEPVRRQVAIKLIRAGLYDRQVLQRFVSERQSLALMNHPAIAKVFDAGTTAEGQPYLVMEYVDGAPITEYCDQHTLTIAERLRLFQQVCEGVQHAHQKAIIHRDLKPSNILVTEVDGRPMPQIIDFGVAKGLLRDVEAQTPFTQIGAVIGTLGYMSPEQSQVDADDIDTRTDVYSLGVILYELLVGTLPVDPKELRSLGSLHRRREAEAPKPSTKLRQAAQTGDEVARNRGTDVAPLLNRLRGDLDSIALKALEHDRQRRYATPSELAADIGNYLRNEPVSAHAPSVAYRARKYVRRHRLGAAVASGGLSLLLIFAVAQTIQLRNTRLERDRADRVTEFVTHIFKVSDPSEARGNTVTAREILDKSSREIESGVGLDAGVQSELLQVMANTYSGLGLYARAHTLAERALQSRRQSLGPKDPKTLESMKQLGSILFSEGHAVEAEAMLQQTLALQRATLGPNDRATIETEDQLAVLLTRSGHNADAEHLERQIIAMKTRLLGPQNPSTLRSMSTLASALRGESRFDEAEAIYRQVLSADRQSLGPDHPDTLATMHNSANLLQAQGRYAEAEILYRDVLAIERRILGPDHPETADTLTVLANDLVHDRTRDVEAEGMYREALAIQLRTVGPENSVTTRSQEGLANVLGDEKHYDEAERIFRELLKVRLKVLGPEHADYLLTECNLAEVLLQEGRFGEGERLLRAAFATQARVLDADDPDVMHSKTLLARAMLGEDRPREALTMAREAFDAQLRVLGPQQEDTLDSLSELGRSLSRIGRYEEAQSEYQSTIAKIAALPKANTSQAWYDFARVAALAGHRNDSVDYLNRAVEAGYADVESLRDSPDLASVRQDPRYAQIMIRAQAPGRGPTQRL